MRKTIRILSTLLICIPLLFMPLQAQKNLSFSFPDSTNPRIAVDSQDRILVIWGEMDWPIPDIVDILYTALEDGVWRNLDQTLSQLYDSRFPSLEVDTEDRFHMAFQDGLTLKRGDVFYRTFRFADNFWSNIERLHQNPQPSSFPEVTVDPSGVPHILWVHEYDDKGNTKIVLKSKDGGLWPGMFRNISKNLDNVTQHPTIKAGPNGVSAAWELLESGATELIYSETVNGNWPQPISLAKGDNPSWPALDIDKQGNIHILYGTETGNVLHVRRSQGVLSTPTIISSGFSPAGLKDLVVHKNNTLHAVWTQKKGTNFSIFYSTGWPNGQWRGPLRVAVGDNADAPQLAVDSDGNAHIVWQETGYLGKPDIFYKKIILPGAHPTALIVPSAESGINPSTILLDGSSSTPGQGNIVSYWWDFGDGTPMVQGASVSHTYTAPGTYTARLYVTNTDVLSSSSTLSLEILAGPYPPENISIQKATIGGLLYRKDVNILTWTANPKNQGVSPSKYYIFRKLKTRGKEYFKKIAEVDGSAFRYTDLDFSHARDRDLYDYALSSVDAGGQEGPLGMAESSPSNTEYSRGSNSKDRR
ncbi:PKD domain-containing protein [Acidobacteriota bacterium]